MPIFGKSLIVGSSFEGEFCAIKNIFLLLLNASSREKIDFSLPTKSVDTVLGKMTTSLSGIIGIFTLGFMFSVSIN